MAEAIDDNQKDIIKEAVRQFVDARLRGEEPDTDEFVKKYPGLESKITEGIKELQKINALFDSIVRTDESDFEGEVAVHDLVGQKLASFEVEKMIGRGGMGVVYLARDTKLDRSVAIKSLPAEVMANPKAQARFQREAKLLASLNHPNIAIIHDIIEQDEELSYLILEYIPGQTLAQRIAHKPLKLEEALSIAQQVAEAVSAAHDKGVIHRDLKPGNIKLAPDGRVKVLDFGLAKASASEGMSGETDVTQAGHIIGTPAYMSPEQARGQATDKRGDIWSFGCVLYEMLTGRIPFKGETTSDTIAKILERDPDWEALPKDTPSNIRVLLRRCLEKDPRRRLHDIADARIEIDETQCDTSGAFAFPAAAVARPRPMRLRVVVGGVTVVALLAGIYYLFFPADVPAPDWQSTALTTSVGLALSPSLSPDGSAIVYAHNAAGAMDIYSKNVVGGVPNQLTSTPFGDVFPRYSPRGNNVAFVSDRGFGALVYWIPSLGGVAKQLANSNISAVERVRDILEVLGGMPWSPDETELLFSRLLPTGQIAIFKTDMSGQATQITFPEPGTDDLCASWSFDGRRIVFQRRSGRSGLWLLPASGGTPQELLVDDFDNSQPAWLEDDRRVIYSSNRAKSWNIWEIDVATRKVRPLTFGSGNHSCPTVSRNGRIAYAQFRHQTDLYVKSVEGDAEPRRLTKWMGDNFAARISPQRNRREVVYHSSRSGDLEIWHRDLESGEEVNLSNRTGLDIYPDWSPNADRIVFVSDRDGAVRPWIMNRDGSLPRRFSDKVISLPDRLHGATRSPRWSADGEAIAYVALGDEGDALWVFDSVGKQEPQQYLSGVLGFEWYGQGHRYVIYRRRADDGEGPMQMYAADLESGAEKLLLEAHHCELIVAPDGSAVAYCDVVAHQTMNIYLLKLQAPETPGQLPTAIGEPMPLVTGGQGRWHTHIGGWSPDSKEIIYTHDEDFGQIWLLSRKQQ